MPNNISIYKKFLIINYYILINININSFSEMEKNIKEIDIR
jgi:hypothetical protein